jgi:hypothetical protein
VRRDLVEILPRRDWPRPGEQVRGLGSDQYTRVREPTLPASDQISAAGSEQATPAGSVPGRDAHQGVALRPMPPWCRPWSANVISAAPRALHAVIPAEFVTRPITRGAACLSALVRGLVITSCCDSAARCSGSGATGRECWWLR